MSYEITVTLNGNHYFSCAKKSIGTDLKILDELYDKFKVLFPVSKGYEIKVYNEVLMVSQPYDIEEERLTGERKKQM